MGFLQKLKACCCFFKPNNDDNNMLLLRRRPPPEFKQTEETGYVSIPQLSNPPKVVHDFTIRNSTITYQEEDEKVHVCGADRFLILVSIHDLCTHTAAKPTNISQDVINDLRPPQTFQFSKASFGYDDVSAMLSDLNSSSSFKQNFKNKTTTWYEFVEPEDRVPLENHGPHNPFVTSIVSFVHRHIIKLDQNNLKQRVALHVFITNRTTMQPGDYNALAATRRQTITMILDDLVRFHTIYDLSEDDQLSKDEWCSKIHSSLIDYDIYLDDAHLEKSANLVMAMIKEEPTPKECVICVQEITFQSLFRTLQPCNHIFHQSCIDKWIQECRNCPVCRSEQSAPIVSSP